MSQLATIVADQIIANNELPVEVQAEVLVSIVAQYIDIHYAELSHRDQNAPLVHNGEKWITFDTWLHEILGA
jgi:hypothetical protein